MELSRRIIGSGLSMGFVHKSGNASWDLKIKTEINLACMSKGKISSFLTRTPSKIQTKSKFCGSDCRIDTCSYQTLQRITANWATTTYSAHSTGRSGTRSMSWMVGLRRRTAHLWRDSSSPKSLRDKSFSISLLDRIRTTTQTSTNSFSTVGRQTYWTWWLISRSCNAVSMRKSSTTCAFSKVSSTTCVPAFLMTVSINMQKTLSRHAPC